MMDWRKIKKIGGWLTEKEGRFLYEEAKKVFKGGRIVEIGSWKGKSTICLAQGSRDGEGARMWAIDPHRGSMKHLRFLGSEDTFGEFRKNIKGLGVEDRVEVLRAKSWEVAPDFEEKIDLLFLDGDHSFRGVLRDWRDWFGKLKRGGKIIFHDSWHRWEVQGLTGLTLLFSREAREARLVDTMTVFEKCRENSGKDRLKNILFVGRRFWGGWWGTVRLVLTGTHWD